MLGKVEGNSRKGQQRMKWLDRITALVDMNLSKLWEIAADVGAWRAAVHGAEKSRTQLMYQAFPSLPCFIVILIFVS